MSSLIAIPLFPLNIFYLPGEILQLHIFEPRYKQLVEDVLNGSIEYFGIPAVFEYPDPMLGILVSLETIVAKHSDGTYDIELKVVDLFELINYQNELWGKLYPGGEVKKLNFEPRLVTATPILKKILELSNNYHPLFRMQTNNVTDVDILTELHLPDDDKLEYALMQSQQERDNFLLYQVQKLEVFLMQHKAFSGDFNLN